MTVGPVLRLLDGLGVAVALIGAHAMAARGYARFTADVDLLTTDSRVLDPGVWAALVNAGASVDARRGDQDDPLAGVVHIQLADGTDIDVVVGRWAWQRAIIERADALGIMDAVLHVPRIGDLILLKLSAGGYVDKQDAAAMFAVGDRQSLVRDVEAHIGDVYPDVTALWRELITSVP